MTPSLAVAMILPDVPLPLHSAWIEAQLPRSLLAPLILGNAPWQWIGVVVSVVLAYAVGRAVARVGTALGRRVVRRTGVSLDDPLIDASARPLRTITASFVFGLLVSVLEVSPDLSKALGHFAYSAFVLGLAWLLLAGFNILAQLLVPEAGREGLSDNAGRRTRRALLQRVASAGVVGVTVALLFLQFDVVRHIGLSLLASAGIASVVFGLAAQRSISGLIAGIQLSITQPVRIGDTVSLDGEPGVIQDIFLTYAVVRFDDERNLIVPLTRFLEQPFQNWTREGRDVSAVVRLSVRFTAPIGLLREKLRAICEANAKWDQRRCELQVVDSSGSGMLLRVVASTHSPSAAADLACELREAMIGVLQTLDGGKHLG